MISLLKQEISQAIRRLDLAFYLAWSDTRTRYRRSVLGPFWLVLGTAIGVGGLAFVWSTLFDVNREEFVLSLTIGLVVWYFLSATIVESSSVFYNSRQLMLNLPISSFLVSIQLLLRQLVNFAHNLVVVAIAVALFPQHLGLENLLAIPGMLLVAANMLAVIQLVGYIGARYRDLEPLLAAIMQPLFFLTPVIFRPQQLGANEYILNFNPFAHWLKLVRGPLMGEVPPPETWAIVACMTIAAWGAAFWMTAAKRQRLAYWVH